MIFATVGTQLPFARLLTALDGIAGRHGLTIIAQTCDPGASFAHLQAHATIAPDAYDRHIRQADMIVGHAGIGTILSAGRAGKPLVLLPRRASMNEHRNEHQLATAASLGQRQGIHVARDEAHLEALMTESDLAPFYLGEGATSGQLVQYLKDYIAA